MPLTIRCDDLTGFRIVNEYLSEQAERRVVFEVVISSELVHFDMPAPMFAPEQIDHVERMISLRRGH